LRVIIDDVPQKSQSRHRLQVSVRHPDVVDAGQSRLSANGPPARSASRLLFRSKRFKVSHDLFNLAGGDKADLAMIRSAMPLTNMLTLR
jgi:hypothetical protein